MYLTEDSFQNELNALRHVLAIDDIDPKLLYLEKSMQPMNEEDVDNMLSKLEDIY